ncbi:probable 3-deoxy-D-manno-octulosonic acid transferase, mitochondrial isoform X1 [Henckelia pumila]|uniref:probable 3-deoxy-D-manno-octulosonic acid transferase, mitochondrial isoform X1 n=1 Tax=Henckelia pumila TaxID=405737 RepID=UPI003C6DD67C
MSSNRGVIVYKIYRALSYGISPLVHLHLWWRKFRGREHPSRWRERLGMPSVCRPNGRLVWFHAVSLGEGLAAIPVIKCCLERRPDVTVLMTTTTASAFEVIKNILPSNVIYQYAPLDLPTAVDTFLHYWKPNAIMLIESELWPNLIMGAARNNIALSLINGRMSQKSFRNWSRPLVLPLITLMLSKFSLILPLSTTQGIHFQLLQATPFIINFCGDLKFAFQDFDISKRNKRDLDEFQAQLINKKVWMASSIHKDEEEVFIGAHNSLKKKHPDLVTIIVPRQPRHGQAIALKFQKEKVCVGLRSRNDKLTAGTNLYVIDSLGELREFYRLTPIAVIGGSFSPGLTGHNIAEAAAAGCAVLTGYHIGHFRHMVLEMQRSNPLSVIQVSGEKLVEAISNLFGDAKLLEARREASMRAYHDLSRGIVENVWRMLQMNIYEQLWRRDE